jgi:hypothetical protein
MFQRLNLVMACVCTEYVQVDVADNATRLNWILEHFVHTKTTALQNCRLQGCQDLKRSGKKRIKKIRKCGKLKTGAEPAT